MANGNYGKKGGGIAIGSTPAGGRRGGNTRSIGSTEAPF